MGKETIRVTLRQDRDFVFSADFDLPGVAAITLDEPPPLGAGHGPNPARLLAAAVGGCLSASLLFCLQKARVAVTRMEATVEMDLIRNAGGRLRVGAIRVHLAPGVEGDPARLNRCREIFEEFCIVTESVRSGIDVQLEVAPAAADRTTERAAV
jgi:organic hydroperoxide reductase OsmC/OhrA